MTTRIAAGVQVAALYRFTRFAAPEMLRAPLSDVARANGVRGTILLAHEGINGTIAGEADGIASVLDYIRALPGCADLDVKFAAAETMPFHRLKVRVKREIVTMGVAGIDPTLDAGTHVSPAIWNTLIADADTITIDTRNDYEVAIGTFAGAIDPRTTRFGDFPAWFAANRALMAGKRIAMFCTGGIRCEKATAFVKAQGIADVYHLEGGILRYLAEMPEAESRWHGECFVFDERVAVGHGLRAGLHTLCRACRMPVSPADRDAPEYIAGVACPRCKSTRDDRQRAGYAERHRQTKLAVARGETHVGAPPR